MTTTSHTSNALRETADIIDIHAVYIAGIIDHLKAIEFRVERITNDKGSHAGTLLSIARCSLNDAINTLSDASEVLTEEALDVEEGE